MVTRIFPSRERFRTINDAEEPEESAVRRVYGRRTDFSLQVFTVARLR